MDGCGPAQQAQGQKQVNQAVQSIPSPVKRGAQDMALTTQVAGAIAAQTGVNVFHVTPSAKAGVVTLTGNTPTPEVKTTILDAVRRVHGVDRVVDRITIAR
jgi:osmotically-inducible protein OsmY